MLSCRAENRIAPGKFAFRLKGEVGNGKGEIGKFSGGVCESALANKVSSPSLGLYESSFELIQVIYALDSAGNLWKKVREEWQHIPNPNDNEN